MFRVLIVDDLEILRRDLKRLPVWGDASGFSVSAEAGNGKEALAKLKESNYDLVITDIRMPLMDGIDLLKAVSKDKLCPCVVLLSDYTEFTYAREGLVHGAFDYLGKPIDQQKLIDLLKRVRDFLEQKRAEEDKLKHLEGMAEVAFYPGSDVEKIARLVSEASSASVESAITLLETIGAALQYDKGKIGIVMKNAVDDVTAKVLKECGWLNYYTDFTLIKALNGIEYLGWDDLKSKATQIISEIVSFMKKYVVWKDSQIAKDACLHVLNHVEEDVSVKAISEKLFISKAYMSEIFKQTTGISLLEYITRIKMERAKFLLLKSSMKNYEIAEKLGFNDHEYFSKLFKKYTGQSPNDFRKKRI